MILGRVTGGDVGRPLGKKHDPSARACSFPLGTWLKMYKKLSQHSRRGEKMPRFSSLSSCYFQSLRAQAHYVACMSHVLWVLRIQGKRTPELPALLAPQPFSWIA